ncbi:mth938 domain-containing protein-like [Neofelis nebulosa]|uniref:mth938 domain-containing protein-like n=1 Tax=Neofelis nebulosa TaxID=61452 RepID=UPI00272C556E|nr:mth938 domain-containing protein-like [Neofelis nebulosa]
MSSPEIASLSRGQMKARSSSKPQKYCRVLPGGSQVWDWRETKSEHYPCMLPAGVEEVIKKDVQMLAIDQGMGEVLKVTPSTGEYLETQGTGVWIIQTQLGCPGCWAGGVFYSTC